MAGRTLMELVDEYALARALYAGALARGELGLSNSRRERMLRARAKVEAAIKGLDRIAAERAEASVERYIAMENTDHETVAKERERRDRRIRQIGRLMGREIKDYSNAIA